MEVARQPPALPMDLLVDIIARCDDVTTVVRCAAGCRALRRAMLAPGFLDLLRRRAEANGGFDPSLLMALSYRGAADSIVVQSPGHLRLDTHLLRRLGSSITASSRDGLLVVLGDEILVCNAITGHVTSLPSTGLRGFSAPRVMYSYQPALLSVHGAGRSFELLVMYQGADARLGAQIFSSQQGKWSAVREIHIHKLYKDSILREAPSSALAVVGRSIHWVCYKGWELIILALNAESAHASVIKLPQELLTRMGSASATRDAGESILATTATVQGEKRLSLLVAEALVISTWTLVGDAEEGSSSISWSRQVVIRRREIDRSVAGGLDAYQPIMLRVFGERSGTVLFWMQHVGLVQLNLGTKKALMLWRGDNYSLHTDIAREFLNEINLISVLECMKSY